jgi:hypothetical protein
LRLVSKNDAVETLIDSLAGLSEWHPDAGRPRGTMSFILKFTSENRLRDATIILVLANICESGFSRIFDWPFGFDLA